MGNFREGIFLILLIILPLSCKELTFSAKENPIKKLQFTIRLVEDLQLFYVSNLLVHADRPAIQVNNYIPLDSVYPFQITDEEGNYSGEGGENIYYDYSDCVTEENCTILFSIHYPGNSMIKERNIQIFVNRGSPDSVTDDTILTIKDEQRLRDGESREVMFIPGEKSYLLVKGSFPPLSPYREEKLEAYFTSVTAGVSGRWYSDKLTGATGTIYLEDGSIVVRRFLDNSDEFEKAGVYTITVSSGKKFDFKGEQEFSVPGESGDISGNLQERYFDFALVPQGRSPVMKREFWYKVTDSVSWGDTIIYNDSTMDRICGRMEGDKLKIKYGEYEGTLSFLNGFESVRFSGTVYGDDGVYNIDVYAPLGVLWYVTYWWDDYHTSSVNSDEEGELSYFLLNDGRGSVTLYQEDGTKSSATYEFKFWDEVIR